MQKAIPTTEDIFRMADEEIKDVSSIDKQQWFDHPCTKFLLLVLEAKRMETLEQMEAGHELERKSAQAEMLRDINIDLHDALKEGGLEDE